MSQAETKNGIVQEVLAGGLYRVAFEDGVEKLAYLCGRMKINRIRVLIGDEVEVVIDPYGGKATNRINRRVKK